MAETAQTAVPGTHPDAVVINDDGTVTAHGRRAWVWVHDEGTGSRYDVPASMLPRQGLRPVEGYPVNTRPHARTPKTALLLTDIPVTAGRASTAAAAEPVSPELAAARAAAAALSASTSAAGASPAIEPDVEAAGSAGDTDAAATTAKARRSAR